MVSIPIVFSIIVAIFFIQFLEFEYNSNQKLSQFVPANIVLVIVSYYWSLLFVVVSWPS